MKTFLILLILNVFYVICSLPLQASDFKSGERVSIDQAVEGDLYVGTGELFVGAPIKGDLIAAAGEITLADSVMQDVLISGGELFLKGYVGDDVRAAGGRITVSGHIDGDLLVFGGDITIEEGAYIGGELRIFGGNVSIQGKVNGDIKTAGGTLYYSGIANSSLEIKGGDIEINGEVMGPATLAASEITLGPNARFRGPVQYWRKDGEMEFGNSLSGADAQFNTDLKHIEGDKRPFGLSWGPFILLYGLSILLILILLNFLFNEPLTAAADRLQQSPAQSLAYGAVYLLGLPVLGILLLITLIGIPLGLLALALIFFSWMFGLSITAVVMAKSLKSRYKYEAWNTWMLVLVSAFCFAVLKLISLIPFVGWLAYLLLVAIAFGSIILDIIQRRRTASQAS